MSDYWTGRETTPVTLSGGVGGETAEQLTGPWHAVEPGGADLSPTTSLCNVAVRVWGEQSFDTGADQACPTCMERASSQRRGSSR
ncbi:hypothetical protein ASG36_01960 [Geodermatophilus sp. Leaf369]|uniref:hypothetical protein n=1 Tax=Geodermatophilus sp. Leaf369 TaxID=1736354 RepID=UPI0006F75F8A|nr:hypothetical protein [Geodermatophilus sp. Leaf369]KQS59832.1 hypothetical protein ASG36_01960 [Geodermatophilus sp. Leaf369]